MEIKRDLYLTKLIQSKENGLIKVVTGLRRSGKSYLLKTLFKTHLLETGVEADHILIIDLENIRNKAFLDINYFIKWLDEHIQDNKTHYLIIDEIQNIPNFTELLGGLVTTEHLDVYVTGSNSHLLSSDVATEFRGRGEEIHLYPLSFAEFCSVYSGNEVDALQEYITYGGLPYVHTLPNDEKKSNYLEQIYRSVYLRDIFERYTIENPKEFQELLRILSSCIGTPQNANKIANTFKTIKKLQAITPKTIDNYINHIENAFLLEEAQRYDIKGRQYIGNLSKYYFQDLGLRNVILHFRQIEETHLMENLLYNQLRMLGYQVDVGNIPIRTTINGEQKRSNLEIDFIVNRGSQRYYIQSAWRLPDAEKREQEIRPFINVADSFPKIVIVGEQMKLRRDENGIIYISIYQFLKEPQIVLN
ncbi:MAG: ATP-binding protein [Paludibacteraceae bacterium]|nr:ATP-binding protein [Paludibacteraceae bacterium]